MSEIWKPIKGYESYYEVSNQGNVRRIGGKKLKPVLDRYYEVQLCINGKRKKKRIHLLVADAFLPKCPGEYGIGRGKYQIDHIDENRLNNCSENLQWLRHEDNCFFKNVATHYFKVMEPHRGEAHGMAKLTETQVRAIRNDNRSQRVIGRDYGVDASLIGLIKRRKCWTHVK